LEYMLIVYVHKGNFSFNPIVTIDHMDHIG
jgi:hypothetical protein